MTVLHKYDYVLSAAILDELETLSGVRIHGITDRSRLEERVPTVSFTWGDRHSRSIAAALGEQGIFVWDGNYYALAVTERLGLVDKGGMAKYAGDWPHSPPLADVASGLCGFTYVPPVLLCPFVWMADLMGSKCGVSCST